MSYTYSITFQTFVFSHTDDDSFMFGLCILAVGLVSSDRGLGHIVRRRPSSHRSSSSSFSMGPPLSPTTIGTIVSANGGAPITIELFLDIVCPFSAKMWETVMNGEVVTASPNVCFVINQVPQPWHPQGTYVHEAALAVKQLAPDKYADFVSALFKAFGAGYFT